MRITAVDSVVEHVLVVLAQFAHWNVVGLFVHDAVSVSVVFTAGALLLAEIEQLGAGDVEGGGVVGGGAVPEPPQFTDTPDLLLVPALFVARSA